jgi:hypothetical protein
LKEDENFRAVTKEKEHFTRFVDVFDKFEDENEIDWKKELKKWIAAAKKNEKIYVEVDFASGMKKEKGKTRIIHMPCLQKTVNRSLNQGNILFN